MTEKAFTNNWYKQWFEETLAICESYYEREGMTLTQEGVQEIFVSLSRFAEELVKREVAIKRKIKRAEKIKEVEKVKNEKLLTVQELAKTFDVPVSWIYQRTSMGQNGIPHIKVGKYVRFDIEEVMGFFKQKG